MAILFLFWVSPELPFVTCGVFIFLVGVPPSGLCLCTFAVEVVWRVFVFIILSGILICVGVSWTADRMLKKLI